MFRFVNVKFMTFKSVAMASLLSTILLVSPVLAVNTAVPKSTTKLQQKLENKEQKIENRIQKLENKLATREAILAQKFQEIKTRIASKEATLAQKLAEIRSKIASKEAALKLKLQQFKDKKKAEIAERINNNLNKINKNQTDQMLKHLNKMLVILDKLEARVDEGKPDIKNPTAAREAIVTAGATIASASAAVQDQALKDYTLVATSEAVIKAEAKAARDRLHADLQAVRKLVIAAKQAVANAIRVAKSGKLQIPGKEGTASGQ